MKLFTGLVFCSLLIGSQAGTAIAQETGAPKEQQPAAQAETILIVTTGKARVRTLADKNGPSVMSPIMGQVLRQVGKQKAAFLPVVAPGGFAVWLFGDNLKTTDVEGVLEVTANAVNQRPMPESTNKSYPLKKRLHSGDKVRVINRANSSLPLDEDWVKVWSSADSVGWILAADCNPVKTDGASMWADAMADLGGRAAHESSQALPAGAKPVANKTTPKAAEIKLATKALDAADAKLDAARGLDAVDLSEESAVYERVAGQKLSAHLTLRAQTGLEMIEVLELAKGLQSDLETVKQRRVEDLLVRQKKQWEKSRQRDPLAGRFDARGVLERRSLAGEAHKYVLRWGPDLVCEVRLDSGRYELDRFAGYELGLTGKLDYTDASALLTERPVLTLRRIEILAKR